MPKDQLGVHVSSSKQDRAPESSMFRRNLTPADVARMDVQAEVDRILEQNDKDHNQEKLIIVLLQQQKFMNQTMGAMQADIKALQSTVTWLRDRVILLCAASAGGGVGLTKGLTWLFG